jgi:archaellum component FlaC
MDINQRIDYLVGLYGVDQVNKGLDSMERKFKKTETSAQVLAKQLRQGTYANQQFLRVVQDAPYFFSSYQMGFMSISNNLPMLAEGFQNARNSGLSFGQALKTTLIGFNPWITAINLAISGFLAWSLYSQNAGKDTDEFAESVKGLETALKNLVKIDNPFSNMQFNLTEKQLNQLISTYETLLKVTEAQIKAVKGLSSAGLNEISTGAAAIAGSFAEIPEELSKSESKYRTILEYLKEQKANIDASRELTEELNNQGLNAVDKTLKSITDRTKELKQNGEEFYQTILRIAKVQEMIGQTPSQLFSNLIPQQRLQPDLVLRNLVEKKDEGITPLIAESQIRATNKEFAIIADSFGSALNTAGQNAFRSIFGEANDLLSLFLQNIATGFLSLAAQNVAGSLLGFLTGTPLGFLAGSPKTSGGGNQTLIVQIGDRQIVTKNNIASTTRRLIRVGEF